MIGFELDPSQLAEVCICEIFGNEVDSSIANIGNGLHPFGDRQLRDEFYKDTIGIDAQRFHVYAVDWRRGRVDFYLDNRNDTEGQAVT
jgi:Glycosyl hydrolases family 16